MTLKELLKYGELGEVVLTTEEDFRILAVLIKKDKGSAVYDKWRNR